MNSRPVHEHHAVGVVPEDKKSCSQARCIESVVGSGRAGNCRRWTRAASSGGEQELGIAGSHPCLETERRL